MSRKYIVPLCVLLIGAFVYACGGGGGSDFTGAARVSIYFTESEIDVGDRTRAQIEISYVAPQGIAIKIRMPLNFKYLNKSSSLMIGDAGYSIEPTNTMSDANYTYLVYYFAQQLFGEDGKDTGVLSFDLLGLSAVKKALIEVDASIDDPSIPNKSEFSVSQPKFQPQDETNVTVFGSQGGGGSATPTATPAV